MTEMNGIGARSIPGKERISAEHLRGHASDVVSLTSPAVTVCMAMPKRLGRLQQQLLWQLQVARLPLRTASLIPGRSGFEKRRALRRLVEKGLITEVRPDTWRLSAQARVRKHI